MNYAAVECPPKVGVAIVGGGILDAPYDGTACKWGVKDAAPYAKYAILLRISFEHTAINDHLT